MFKLIFQTFDLTWVKCYLRSAARIVGWCRSVVVTMQSLFNLNCNYWNAIVIISHLFHIIQINVYRNIKRSRKANLDGSHILHVHVLLNVLNNLKMFLQYMQLLPMLIICPCTLCNKLWLWSRPLERTSTPNPRSIHA